QPNQSGDRVVATSPAHEHTRTGQSTKLRNPPDPGDWIRVCWSMLLAYIPPSTPIGSHSFLATTHLYYTIFFCSKYNFYALTYSLAPSFFTNQGNKNASA